MKRAGCTDTHAHPMKYLGHFFFLVLRKLFRISTFLAGFVLTAALTAFPLCRAGAPAEAHIALAGKPWPRQTLCALLVHPSPGTAPSSVQAGIPTCDPLLLRFPVGPPRSNPSTFPPPGPRALTWA